jgi:hypothetical protein
MTNNMKEKLLKLADILLPLATMILIGGGIAWLVSLDCEQIQEKNNKCTSELIHTTITDIGGCDRTGVCGVVAKEISGAREVHGVKALYPARGDEACFCPSVRKDAVPCKREK